MYTALQVLRLWYKGNGNPSLCVGDVALFLLKVGTRVLLLKSLQMSYICRPVVLSILARRLKVSPCIHKLNELINNTCS